MVSNPTREIKKENDKPFCCKFCGSQNFIKYGKKNNRQQFFCKDCKRKFVDNLYFEKLKADPPYVTIQDIANKTKLSRETVSKYMLVLEAENKIKVTKIVGKAKLFEIDE